MPDTVSSVTSSKQSEISRRKARNLLCSVSLSIGLACMAPMTALAQDKSITVSLPAQPVAMSLKSFARLAGVQIIYPHDKLTGVTANELVGSVSLEQGLKKILAGTGLVFRVTEKNVIVITPAAQKSAAVHKAGYVPVAGKGVAVQESMGSQSGASSDGSIDSSLSGHVTEINTGSNLAGALVKIVETGQTTKTDDLGNFRFSSVAPGNYTLTISYLGFASLITELSLGRGEEFQNEFSMGKSLGELDEIVVFGSRSARARALNLQRTAENSSSVVSADDLGNFTGTTISEALRRVAGVAFQRDPRTGAGTNIIIRGLEPDMNAVKLNGLNLPVGNGLDRSANLNNILADSVEKITIHKTLLPSHDSAGTGGLVEIETKSPLNRPQRYINLLVEGGKKGDDFGDDYLLSGTVAGTFGSNENFGLSASVQYRKTSNKTLGYNTNLRFGQYLPLFSDGYPHGQTFLDPRLNFPYEAGVEDVYPTNSSINASRTDGTTLGLTFSAEWQVADHTSLQMDIQHSKSSSSGFTSMGNTFGSPNYRLREVAALGGEERQTLVYGDPDAGEYDMPVSQFYNGFNGASDVTDVYSFRGNTTFGKWNVGYTLGYTHGTHNSGDNYFLSLGYGSFFGADPVDGSFFLPEATDPVEGIIISPYRKRTGNGLPLPLFTDKAWDFFNDPSSYSYVDGDISHGSGKNDIYTAAVNAKYEIDGPFLKYMEVGVTYETSRASHKFSQTSYDPILQIVAAPPPVYFDVVLPGAEPLGLTFEETDLSRLGFGSQGFNYLTEESVKAFFDHTAAELAVEENPILAFVPETTHPFADQQFTKESSLAAYWQARVDIGRLEIIGGVRVSRVKVRAAAAASPRVVLAIGVEDQDYIDEFTYLLDETAVQTDILPRVGFNYRQTDNLIFRGGYFLTTARPSLSALTEEAFIELDLRPDHGPDENLPQLSIFRGNPDLKPARTHNFDFSAEYYHDQIGLIKVSAFYKRTVNAFQNSQTTSYTDVGDTDFPDDSHLDETRQYFSEILPLLLAGDDAIFIVASHPENGADPTTIWGFEGHIERQFTFLPGFWNGFGVYANFTYAKSSSNRLFNWGRSPILDADGNLQYNDPGIPESGIVTEAITYTLDNQAYKGSPKTSGTVALTYNKHNIDATLAYGFQARAQSNYRANNLDGYSEGVGTLDFRLSYYFGLGGGNFRAYVEGSDILKGSRSPDLENTVGGVDGIPKYYTSATYLGGRTMKIGLSASF